MSGKFLNYSEDAMNNAIQAVKNGMSYAKASKLFSVPRSTLTNKITGKSPLVRKMGPNTILSTKEEEALVQWICRIARAGFPLIKDDILVTVQRIMINTGRENPFTNNKPGRHWFEAFLRRHPELSKRTPEHLTSVRSNVTEMEIRAWFQEVEVFLKEENMSGVLEKSSQIFNCDESAFQLCPKTGKVIAPRGEKNLYDVSKASDKDSITVSLTVCANGTVLPPFLVYPYVRIPSEVVRNVPNNWALGKTESGWMTGESFYEYITNVFHPWLIANKIEFPVILFLDGHKSHLTMHLSNFCNEKGIVIVALFPNSTHIIQPCDVSVFKPLKDSWKKVVHKWKLTNFHESVTKQNFPILFSEVLNEVKSTSVVNGFKKCGIFPWNPDAVDFSKCKQKVAQKENSQHQVGLPQNEKSNHKVNQHLTYLETKIDSELLTTFQKRFEESRSWNGPEKSADLFEVWCQMKIECEGMNGDGPSCETTASLSQAHLSQGNNQHSVDTGTITETGERTLCPVGLISEPGRPTVEDGTKTVDMALCHPAGLICEPSTSATPTRPVTTTPASIHIDESTNSSVGSPFKKALFWPEEKTTSKKKRKTDKLPAVVTSKAWKQFYMKKDEEKARKEKEKEDRKLAREEKKRKRLEEVEKRKQLKTGKPGTKKQKNREIYESESTSEGSVIYANTSDSSGLDFSEDESSEVVVNSIKSLETEKYYAVYYDEQFFIGRIISIAEKIAEVKFLKEVTDNTFVWPSITDVDKVQTHFIFHGPIALIGNGPFSLRSSEMFQIKCAYRRMKSKA